MPDKLEVMMNKVSKIVAFVRMETDERWKKVQFTGDEDEEENGGGIQDAEDWVKKKAFDVLDAEEGDAVDVLVARAYREGTVVRKKKVVTVEL